MALNRTKVLEAAQKYLQKGQHDKAIAEYQKLVKEDSRDVRTLLKIGDLHTRRGNHEQAIATYSAVAEQYAKQGFFLKAVAVYKQILKLDPDRLEICEKLASMYDELALVSDALSTYEMVSDRYLKLGDLEHAIQTMQKMVSLEPDNVAVRIKLAETLSRASRKQEAAEAFASGAELLKGHGRMDDYIRVAERQLYHESGNVTLASELATLYLERKDAKRALAKLQLCFKENPRDIAILEMLAEAFRQLGQGSKTISVLREIARIHGDTDAHEPRRKALARILDLDPDDQEAREALGLRSRGDRAFGATMIDQRSSEERAEDAARRDDADDDLIIDHGAESEEDLLLDDDNEQESDILIVDEESSSSQLPVESPPTKRERERSREPESREQRAARLSAEADIKAAAGLWLEVEGLLKEVLEIDPDDVPARERLKDLYLELDRKEEAVGELLILADAWLESNLDRAIGYTQHAVRLAPDDPRPRLRLGALQEQQDSMDPLDQPIAPDDFEIAVSAPPSAMARHSVREMDVLLDAPIEDDFDGTLAKVTPGERAVQPEEPVGDPILAPRIDAPLPQSESRNTLAESLPRPSDVDGLLDGTMSQGNRSAPEPDFDVLLDAPIEDDFGVPPPRPSAQGLEDERSVEVLLEAPIDPDEFGAAAASNAAEPALALDPLDAPIEDDFDRIPDDESPEGARADLERMLDAPIEDDFERPAGAKDSAGRPSSRDLDYSSRLRDFEPMANLDDFDRPADFDGLKRPAELESLDLNAGVDDFGLTDAQFDRSDLLDANRFSPALVVAPDQEQEQDKESLEYASIDTSEVQLVEAEVPLPEFDSDPLPAPAPTAEGLIPPEELGEITTKGNQPSEYISPSKPPPDLGDSVTRESALEPLAAEALDESLKLSTGEVALDRGALRSGRPPSDIPRERTSLADEPEAEDELSPEIEETIDEADFFFAQGMYDDAIEAIQESLFIFPNSRALQAKLEEYESASQEALSGADEAQGQEKGEADESFRLAEQLADELTEGDPEGPGESVDVEQVFAQFKKGVAKQISQDDSSTHFDLGIAYKEMGLIDDSISEFRTASRDPARTSMALTMVGTCLLECGRAREAIAEFNEALACETGDARASLGLRYEIGTAYEMLGDVDRALEALEQVAARDPNFREVKAKLRTLRSQATSKTALDDESGDLDRAFDDLLGDDP